LVFAGNVHIIDKPLARFLDDTAATKFRQAYWVDPDALAQAE